MDNALRIFYCRHYDVKAAVVSIRAIGRFMCLQMIIKGTDGYAVIGQALEEQKD